MSTMLRHLRARTPLILGLLVLFVGIFVAEATGWYQHIAHLDKVFHTLGGLILGWMAMAIFQDDIRQLPGYKQLLIITAIACFIGVIWEFLEYLSNFTRTTYPLWYHYYHGGNLADTLGDILADISGGALFALWALWREGH